MSFIAWFSELSKEDVPLVGGKGANLGEMYNAKMPVPPGFVVTSVAFKTFIESTGIDKQIFSTLKNLDVENNEALQQASNKVSELVLKTPMPKDIARAITEAYDDLNVDEDIRKQAGKQALEIVKSGREPPMVAIRSSATAEDLPSISEEEHVFVKVNGHPTYCRMKELYEKIGDGTAVNLEVPSMKGNRLQWTRAQQIYKHWAKGDRIYKITTNCGKEITITPNHSLIVLDPDTLSPKTTSIDRLNPNDLIPTVSKLPEINIDLTHIDLLDYVRGHDVAEENGIIKIKNKSNNWKIQNGLRRRIKITGELLYFLGIYVAEGCTYKNNGIIITNTNRQILAKIKGFLTSIGLYKEQKINKHSIRVYCKPLVRFLHEVTGKPLNQKGKGRSCKIKRVPNFIFGLKKEQIAEFLKGCFDGDGYISKKGAIQFCSTSDMLAGGITKLLETLGFKLYLSRKETNKGSPTLTISIPYSEAGRFRETISSEHPKKIRSMDVLVKLYESRRTHPDFKQTIEINNVLSQHIRRKFEETLEKQLVAVPHCPKCKERIKKSSKYRSKERYLCTNCRKTFYEEEIKKTLQESYVYYDERGRFRKGAAPHNKSVFTGKYSLNRIQKLLGKYGLQDLITEFNGDIRWEKIQNISPLEYKGWVYDFTVPHIENFVSGIGGIITHNTASFAGQQATFLNVKGTHMVLNAVQKCWASLYTARAIYYRIKNNFPHEKVLLAAVVQKMVASDKAGVMFSINPTTNNENEIMIEASYGLGETVVSGSVTPDQYIIDKSTEEIKNVLIGTKEWMLVLDATFGKNVKRNVPPDKRKEQALTDRDIETLTQLAKRIEHHYGAPQDLEFAIQGSKVYIVQSRPVTTMKKMEEEEREKQKTKLDGRAVQPVVMGIPASPGIAVGPVRIVHGIEDLGKIQKGDVLVADMTNPDYVPAMEKSVAIITNRGGSTAHAAIVGREMGLPVIVGTKNATHTLKEGETVTVDASTGKVYRGDIQLAKPAELKEEAQAAQEDLETATEVKVIMDLPQFAEKAAATGADGVGLLRCEMMMANQKAHPSYLLRTGRREELIRALVEGVSTIARAFEGKSVWYRTSDFRTDEYRDLEGGKDEPEEDNPMLGYHGIRRGIAEQELLMAEFEAIKQVHESGLNKVGVMIPMVTHLDQVKTSKRLLAEAGFKPGEDIEFGVMVETPASVQIIEEMCKVGIDFVSFGTNDLTQFTLALDRNNEHVANLYDEMHPAVLRQIKHVIDTCKRYNIETSICGQAGSRPEMAEFLVKAGIDSISANPDAVHKIRYTVSRAERKLLLDVARKEAQSDRKH